MHEIESPLTSMVGYRIERQRWCKKRKKGSNDKEKTNYILHMNNVMSYNVRYTLNIGLYFIFLIIQPFSPCFLHHYCLISYFLVSCIFVLS